VSVSVEAEPACTLAGTKVAVTPLGSPVAESVTVLEAPETIAEDTA
jgi:hypothetical protein